MKSLAMKETDSPRGRRFYIDGKRVSRDAYQELEIRARSFDCLHSERSGDVTRRYKNARL